MEDDILIEIIIKKLNAIHDLILEKKKPFLDIDGASNYLGISKNTLYGYTSKNVIPYHKIQGRKPLLIDQDIDCLNEHLQVLDGGYTAHAQNRLGPLVRRRALCRSVKHLHINTVANGPHLWTV